MLREVYLNCEKIQYNLQYKKVKNINLRIKPDGTIHVSANKRVSENVIDEFIISKTDFILHALKKYEQMSEKSQKQFFEENEIRNVIRGLCEKVYPYYEKRDIKYPQIKFRKMVSRWGSCHPSKGILTFNINLIYAPPECVEYVVLHEFTHFLQANHSSEFYAELAKVCPDWKAYRKKLKEISIR